MVETITAWHKPQGLYTQSQYVRVTLPTNVKIGDKITISTSRYKGRVVDIGRYSVIVRNEDGHTLTMLLYNPVAEPKPVAKPSLKRGGRQP